MQLDLAGRRELQPDRRSCASCLDAAARDIEICVPSQRGASFCDHAEDFPTERATSSPVGEARAPRERPILDLWRIPRLLLEAAGCRVRRWCGVTTDWLPNVAIGESGTALDGSFPVSWRFQPQSTAPRSDDDGAVRGKTA